MNLLKQFIVCISCALYVGSTSCTKKQETGIFYYSKGYARDTFYFYPVVPPGHKFFWKFQYDSNYVSETNPKYVFRHAGTYEVRLYVDSNMHKWEPKNVHVLPSKEQMRYIDGRNTWVNSFYTYRNSTQKTDTVQLPDVEREMYAVGADKVKINGRILTCYFATDSSLSFEGIDSNGSSQGDRHSLGTNFITGQTVYSISHHISADGSSVSVFTTK